MRALWIALLLTGCVDTSQVSDNVTTRLTRPICTTEAECDVGWKAAEAWKAAHPEYDTELTKKKQKDGSYQIFIDTHACNLLACVSDNQRAEIEFNRTVTAAMKAPQPQTPQ